MTDAAPASPDVTPGAALAKAALYLRVSTGRQAESDLSIPDQRRQITAYCLAKGWDVAAEIVEPGNTATDDRRSAGAEKRKKPLEGFWVPPLSISLTAWNCGTPPLRTTLLPGSL
jgi:Resolvase, N terminal domain